MSNHWRSWRSPSVALARFRRQAPTQGGTRTVQARGNGACCRIQQFSRFVVTEALDIDQPEHPAPVFRQRIERGDHPLQASSEAHTSELQSLMRIPYAVFSLQ